MKRPALLLAVFALAFVSSVLLLARPQQVPGTFRTQITLVPIDVRVVDREGKPVTDLTKDDFMIFENGVRQSIAHFSSEQFKARQPEPGERLELKKMPTRDLTAQNHRIFLLVMGRGRLNNASDGVAGAIKFVKQNLLPQDLVAVVAWNRATDFTYDHDRIAQILDNFKKKHEGIESKLANALGGLAGIYGSKGIPPALQGEIDAIFTVGGTSSAKTLGAANISDAPEMTKDGRRTTDALMVGDIAAMGGALGDNAAVRSGRGSVTPTGGSVSTRDTSAASMSADLGLDEYVSRGVETMQDTGNIYAGVEYLRWFEGEKHLVFFTEKGLFLHRVENDKTLATEANDARVAIDTVHVGGLGGNIMSGGWSTASPTAWNDMITPGRQTGFSDAFSIASLRNISMLTGGQSFAYQYADKALAKISETTMSEYLLGYYPGNTNWNGAYRRIMVRVNRPGVTVLFRHGYKASTVTVPIDREAFLTYRRISAAGSYDKEVSDIKVTLNAEVARDENKVAHEATAQMLIDMSKVVFRKGPVVDKDAPADAPPAERYLGKLDISMFVGDDKEHMLGELWQIADLKLKDDTYQKYMKEGMPFTMKVPLNQNLLRALATMPKERRDNLVIPQPKYVKVIVYNYEADLVGSAIVKVK